MGIPATISLRSGFQLPVIKKRKPTIKKPKRMKLQKSILEKIPKYFDRCNMTSVKENFEKKQNTTSHRCCRIVFLAHGFNNYFKGELHFNS